MPDKQTLRDKAENLLYAVVIMVEPDEDGQSNYDSNEDQEQAGKEAVESCLKDLMQLIEADKAEAVLEARIDELQKLFDNYKSVGFHSNMALERIAELRSNSEKTE